MWTQGRFSRWSIYYVSTCHFRKRSIVSDSESNLANNARNPPCHKLLAMPEIPNPTTCREFQAFRYAWGPSRLGRILFPIYWVRNKERVYNALADLQGAGIIPRCFLGCSSSNTSRMPKIAWSLSWLGSLSFKALWFGCRTWSLRWLASNVKSFADRIKSDEPYYVIP